MCEIQISLRIGEDLTFNDKKEFLKLMNKGSQYNRDAYGIFSSNYSIKEGTSFNEKKNKDKKRELLKKTGLSFLVGHNRLSTLGKASNNQNNHPIETKHWIVVHNGCLWNYKTLAEIYNLKYDEEVDSAIIPYLLEEFEANIKEKPLDAVISLASILEGSFSVVAYSKTDKCLYYFKNNKTNFYFSLVEDDKGKVILGSTNEESLNEAYFDYDMIFPIETFIKKITIDAIDNIVYRLNEKGIHQVGLFEETPIYSEEKEEDKYERYNDNFDSDDEYYRKENKYYTSKSKDTKEEMKRLFGVQPDNERKKKVYTIDDWNDLYPSLVELLLRVDDDLKFNFNLKQSETNYKLGCIWYKCVSKKVRKEIKKVYPFAERKGLGFILLFDDIWDNLYQILDDNDFSKLNMDNFNSKFNDYPKDNSLISTLEREIPHITEEKVEDNDNDKDEEFIIDVS